MPLLISSNPTYTVSAVSQVSEGTSILFTVTADVPNGTVLYWTNAGTTSAADFVQAVIFGSFTMNSGTGSVTLTPISDLTIDDSETIIFQVRENSIAGPIVATATATVRDQAVVTRILNNWTASGGFVSATDITESGRIDFIITTVGLSDGTTLYWTNAGTTSASDFLQNVNSGSFIVTGNQGTFSLNIAPDGWPAEGPETVVIQIRTGSIAGTIIAVSAPLTITDTNYPPLPGDFIFGGYFAGYVSYNGDNVASHYLIVSPKGGGRAASIQFANGFIGSPGTNDPINGLNNTLNMNNAQHPAAQFCRGLQINGYSDWYMPAPLEQNIIYYNLKPTTGANNTSNGANLYAVPQRPNNYTATDPVQTLSTLFRTGGAESYESDLCWDSMQEFNGAGYAFRTFFGSGSSYPPAFTDSKTTFRQVRAVRRQAIAAFTTPGAPTLTGVSVLSGQSVRVNYTAPASNGGATILSYTAISNPGGVSATVSTSGSGSIDVGGLALGQPYTFVVYATNAAGNSLTSNQSNSVTPTFTTSVTYSYTGANQSFTVPASVTFVRFKIWGAGGSGRDTAGGAGGFTQATITTTPGTVFTLIVGQASYARDGGTNFGGGARSQFDGGNAGGDGGGRSAVRTSGGTEILTAGGGGGGGYQAGGAGGRGGGLLAENGSGIYPGLGGSQTAGGSGVCGNQCSGAGSQFTGGGTSPGWTGGGGGGGWYGGSGGAGVNGSHNGGGGGSGFVGRNGSATLAGTEWGTIGTPEDPNGRTDTVSGITYYNTICVRGNNTSDPDWGGSGAGNSGIGGAGNGRIVVSY